MGGDVFDPLAVDEYPPSVFERAKIFGPCAHQQFSPAWPKHLARALGPCHRRKAGADRSIDVSLIAAGFLQLGEECAGLFERTCAMFRDYIEQGALDVFAHRDGAADIDMCALGDPTPQIAAGLAHAVLHIDLPCTVARPSQR